MLSTRCQGACRGRAAGGEALHHGSRLFDVPHQRIENHAAHCRFYRIRELVGGDAERNSGRTVGKNLYRLFHFLRIQPANFRCFLNGVRRCLFF